MCSKKTHPQTTMKKKIKNVDINTCQCKSFQLVVQELAANAL